jgi:hypothetical protein
MLASIEAAPAGLGLPRVDGTGQRPPGDAVDPSLEA